MVAWQTIVGGFWAGTVGAAGAVVLLVAAGAVLSMEVRVATFNIERLGDGKMGKPDVVEILLQVRKRGIPDYSQFVSEGIRQMRRACGIDRRSLWVPIASVV